MYFSFQIYLYMEQSVFINSDTFPSAPVSSFADTMILMLDPSPLLQKLKQVVK